MRRRRAYLIFMLKENLLFWIFFLPNISQGKKSRQAALGFHA